MASDALPPSDPTRELHRLRDLEEDDRLRQLGGIVVHDLYNAMFAVTGRVQILRRRAGDPSIAKQADEILAAVRMLEEQLARLHAACRRQDPGDGPSAVRETLRAALASSGLASVADLSELPSDLSFSGAPTALSTAVRQLASLHRARGGATAVRAWPTAGGDGLLRCTIEWVDAGGAWNHPLAAPSLLGGEFDLATLAVASAQRATRDFGGAVTLERTTTGLRSTLVFEARHGIALASNPREDDDACEHHDADAPPARRVLIADDDPAVRAVLVAALESVGDDVDTISDPGSLDGVPGLGDYDVVILDAGGGGLAALARLRARGVEVPVLVASGDHVDGSPDPLTRSVLKPIPLERLDRELTALAARRPRP